MRRFRLRLDKEKLIQVETLRDEMEAALGEAGISLTAGGGMVDQLLEAQVPDAATIDDVRAVVESHNPAPDQDEQQGEDRELRRLGRQFLKILERPSIRDQVREALGIS